MADGTIKVLIVDDSPLDAEVTASELRESGLATEFATARDERELRAALTTFSADVILCDFALPQFDGLEAVAVMREYRPDVPVIFVSGTISEERAALALASGAVDYVLKSNLTRLPSAVRRAASEAHERKRLRGSVVVAELDRRRRSERSAALWQIANDYSLAGDALLVAMLSHAAGALSFPQPFGGVLKRQDGSDVVVLAATPQDEDGRGRVPDVGERLPLATTLAARGGRTESWADLTAPSNPPIEATRFGWRSVITTRFAVGDKRYYLTFASLESLTRPFGPESIEYVELLASAFATRMRLDDLETWLRASEVRSKFRLERLERLLSIESESKLSSPEMRFAMLGDAASSIRAGVVFRAAFARIDGATIVQEYIIEPDDLESGVPEFGGNVDVRIPLDGTIVQRVLAIGGGPRAFDDLRGNAVETSSGRRSGWRSLLANAFLIDDATYVLTFFHTEPMSEAFGPHDLIYIKILGSLFARHV